MNTYEYVGADNVGIFAVEIGADRATLRCYGPIVPIELVPDPASYTDVMTDEDVAWLDDRLGYLYSPAEISQIILSSHQRYMRYRRGSH